ncbi:MAG: hypothetical protein GX317_12395 [Staphylococcus equorum]|nr:hypothetical protein [Staphylococcus equorum]
MNKIEKFNFEKFKKKSRNIKLESDKIIFEEYFFSRTLNYFLGKLIIDKKDGIHSILITEQHENKKITWTEQIITENFLKALKNL